MALSPIEGRLLDYFIAHPRRILTHRELLVEVWGYREEVSSRTVYVTVNRLRHKIEADAAQPVHIKAVRGGYLYEPAQDDAGLPGRAEALAQAATILAEAQRVWISGAPGIGKSALAAALAPDALTCRCGAGSGPLVALAQALGLPATEDPALIGRALAARGRLTLILDEVEGADDLPGWLQGWRTAAPELRVVLTARSAPPGEPALALPPLSPAASEALFLSHLRAARPGAVLPDEQRPQLQALLVVLDGVPLGLELAARRLAMLSLAELAQRVAAGLDVLVDREGRSLRAAITLSWNLLPAPEQAALRAAALYPAPFSAADLEAVHGPDALDRLEHLLHVGLIHLHTSEEDPRYRLLTPIRHFALEQRRARPDPTDSARMVRWMARWDHPDLLRQLRAARSPDLARALLRDLPNLAAAQAVAQRDGPADEATRVTLTLFEAVILHGPYRLGLQALDGVLQGPLAAQLSPAHALRLRTARLDLLQYLGHPLDADTLDATLDQARALGDRALLADVLRARGYILRSQARAAEAEVALQEARALCQATPSGLLCRVLSALAAVRADQGDESGSAQWEQEALQVALRIGDVAAQALCMGNLAIRHEQRGELGEALRHAQEALRIHQARGYARGVGFDLIQIGRYRAAFGDLAGAREDLAQALVLHRRHGDRRNEALTWITLGHVAGEADDTEALREATTAAQALCRAMGNPRLEAMALLNQATSHVEHGRWSDARACAEPALALAEGAGARALGDCAAVITGLTRVALGEGADTAALDPPVDRLRASGGDALWILALLHRGLARKLAGDAAGAAADREVLARWLQARGAPGTAALRRGLRSLDLG